MQATLRNSIKYLETILKSLMQWHSIKLKKQDWKDFQSLKAVFLYDFIIKTCTNLTDNKKEKQLDREKGQNNNKSNQKKASLHWQSLKKPLHSVNRF